MKALAPTLLSIAAVSLLTGCARDPAAVRFRDVQQTGCRNPGYPADLRARGITGMVELSYVVDRHGNVAPDSQRLITTSDSGFVDSAWAAIRSCHYLPKLIDGHAASRTMMQRVFFRLAEPAGWSAISDMYDFGDESLGDSARLVAEARHRVYLMGTYTSFTNTFALGAETICLFLGIAFGATRLGWRRPVVVAFGVTTVVTAAFLLLVAVDMYEAKSAAAIARSVIVSLVGASLSVGAIAGTFNFLGDRSMTTQVAGSALIAVLMTPCALLLAFAAACIVGLGCF